MARNKINVAYIDQRKQARNRGLGWYFTYETWVAWWFRHLGPNWFQMRGRRKDQYCMARFGDDGPYIEGNVECILSGQNGRDRLANGKTLKGSRNGNSTLTEKQVLTIRWVLRTKPEVTLAGLARRYGVRYQTIQGIKYNRMWKHI